VDFMTLSKLFIGSRRLGYTATALMEAAQPDLDLATATAISGAAIGQAVVQQRKAPVEFIMALFNLRMGFWMINPAYVRWCHRQRRHASSFALFKRAMVRSYSGPFLFFKELLGWTNAASTHIHLTDGGHIEDLGLYELLHRRCKYIIVCDASSEDEGPYHYRFNRVATAIRLARINQGVEIVLDLTKLQPDPETGYTQRHYTVGQVKYPERPALGLPQETGYLLYVKQCMTGMERIVDVWNQRAKEKSSRFPNEPTSNQFFSEAQFEAYRALGYHIMRGICADANRHLHLVNPDVGVDSDVVNVPMHTWFLALLRCCADDGDMLSGTSIVVREGSSDRARVAASDHAYARRSFDARESK